MAMDVLTTERTWPDATIVGDLAALRATNPLVHCVTNLVVTGFTANILLAVGASPAMVVAAEEVGDFAPVAQGLLVNVGTVTSADVAAMLGAADAADQAGTPWVLDPVAVGALRFRSEVVDRLIDHRPSIIRGNASEILALAGEAGASKGADSTAASSEAIDGARALVDYITDGDVVIAVPGGHELLTKITGSGCALGAVLAAFLGVSASPLQAAVSGSAVYARAGELAARTADGPGSLAVALLDQLFLIGTDTASAGAAR
jgi:hydroxyethylthiazole kinase